MSELPEDRGYQDILAHLTQGIVVQDADGKITLANAAAERILDLTSDQMRGRTSLDPRWRAVHADGSGYPGETHPAIRTLATGQAILGDIMGIHKSDGCLTWIAIDTTPIFKTGGGLPDAVISVFSDVTAQRTLEAALAETESHFLQLAENIDIAFWIITPDWRHVDYISPAYEQIWQRSTDSLYADGMSWFEAVCEEDCPALQELIRNGVQPGWESIDFPPYRIRRPDGSTRWISARAFPILDAQGKTSRVAGIALDVTDRYEAERRLEELAHLDTLTHLPNRILLADRMQQAIARSARTGELLAVCLLDLDGFKLINDQLGHKAGDELLIQLAGRLTHAIRADDTVARLGGDEFVLLLGGIRNAGEMEDALARVLAVIAKPYLIQDQTAKISASIGATLYPNDGNDADTLLRHADHAMYLAKQAGKNRYHIFNPALEIRERENKEAIQRIDNALKKQQFRLYYQPIVDCRRGQTVGVEALIRWQHPILGLLNPSEFLPLVEQHDRLALELGHWVIREAVAQADAWRKDGLELTMNINIFPQQFRETGFQSKLMEILADHPDLPPENLTLEIVESNALEDIISANRLIQSCRGIGIHFALDDFGTGYSSLTYLKRLPVQTLKVDRTFIRDMLLDPEDMTIVEAVIGLGTAFRHSVVAEGVETLDQILMLAEMGCHLVQGYFLAHPMSADDFRTWIDAFEPDPRWRMSTAQHLSRDDFQLILAEIHHRKWLIQLTAWLRAKPEADFPPPPLEINSCNFGRWYFSEGGQRYGPHVEFEIAGAAHEQIHAIAQECVARHLAGNHADSRQCEVRLMDASDLFIATLAKLRRAVSRQDSTQ